jgi:hypothetical protein
MKDLYNLYLINPGNSEVVTVVNSFPADSECGAPEKAGGARLMARKNASALIKTWGRELYQHGKVYKRHLFCGEWRKPIVHVQKVIDL